jgi:flagellar biosynthesis/type III secretory pathway protein FliH
VSREDELERARQEGYRSGFHRGRTEGTEETLRQVRASRDLLIRVAEEFKADRDALLRSLEEEMVRLALAIAERVVGEVAGRDRELVLLTVREALRRAQGEGSVMVRVNPADLETVRRDRECFRDALDGIEKIDFVADRRVGPGGCIVETASMRLDARVEAQVTELTQAIVDHLEEKHDSARLDRTAPPDA